MKSKSVKKYAEYTKMPFGAAVFMCCVMSFYALLCGMGDAADDEAVIDDAQISEVLSVGDRGDEVRLVQEKLRELGYYDGEADGVYGRSTSAAVREFQLDEGLTADGKAGAAELDALGIYSDPSDDVLDLGSSGNDVMRLQRTLRRLGYYSGELSGRYGSLTASAVRDFRRDCGLEANGGADSEVMRRLGLDGSESEPYDGGYAAELDLLARLCETVAADEIYAAKVSSAAAALNRAAKSGGTLTLAAAVRLLVREYGGNSAVLSPYASDRSRRAAADALMGCDPTGGCTRIGRGNGDVVFGEVGFYDEINE